MPRIEMILVIKKVVYAYCSVLMCVIILYSSVVYCARTEVFASSLLPAGGNTNLYFDMYADYEHKYITIKPFISVDELLDIIPETMKCLFFNLLGAMPYVFLVCGYILKPRFRKKSAILINKVEMRDRGFKVDGEKWVLRRLKSGSYGGRQVSVQSIIPFAPSRVELGNVELIAVGGLYRRGIYVKMLHEEILFIIEDANKTRNIMEAIVRAIASYNPDNLTKFMKDILVMESVNIKKCKKGTYSCKIKYHQGLICRGWDGQLWIYKVKQY